MRRKLMVLLTRDYQKRAPRTGRLQRLCDRMRAAVWEGLSEPCAHALAWIRKPEASWGREAERLSQVRGPRFGAEFLECARGWQQARQDAQFDEQTTEGGHEWGCSPIRSQAHLLLIEAEGDVVHPWARFLGWWMRRFGASKHAARLGRVEARLFAEGQTLRVPGGYAVRFTREPLAVEVAAGGGGAPERFSIYSEEEDVALEQARRLRARIRALEGGGP